MCFDLDSSPPIPRIAGGSVDHEDLVLTASDGNEFAAFAATDGNPAGPAICVLPDVRGLFRFYEELALRFAEHGMDAIAIDYFGRTAGVGKRQSEWEYMPHVLDVTIEGLTADVEAALDVLRAEVPDRPVFVVGFCFGGSNAWHMAAADLGLAGAIGFYGNPTREGRPIGSDSVIDSVPRFSCPILALQAGDDPGIPQEASRAFEDAMDAAGKAGEVVIYEGAPHSFFDRKYETFSEASADAWTRIQRFIAQHAS